MTQHTQNQVFNALNGEEVIQVIAQKISDAVEEKLRLTGEFRPHSTFPWWKVSAKVSILSYPQQAREDEPRIKIEAEVKAEGEPPEFEPLSTVVEFSETIDTPDRARVEAGLPIPTIGKGPGGVLVDKPTLRKNKVGVIRG